MSERVSSGKQAAIRQWLIENVEHGSQIDLDFDLIENRALDSLKIMKFIYFLEEVIEREIPITKSSVAHMRTLRSIYNNFLEASEEEAS